MNILSASPGTPENHFTIEAEEAADFLKRTIQSEKEHHEHYLKESFKKDANIGVMVRGVTKKAENLTAALFNTLNFVTIITTNNSGVNKVIQKQIVEGFKNLSGRFATSSTGLNASTSFNTVRVSHELAELATPHIAKHIERASMLSDNFIRNVEAKHQVPWNKQYTKLAAKYNSKQLTRGEVKRQSDNLLLEPHGIRDGLITAGGINMLADKFNVPVKNKLFWKNTSIAVFNDNANTQTPQLNPTDFGRSMQDWVKNATQSVADTITRGLQPEPVLIPVPIDNRPITRGPSLFS